VLTGAEASTGSSSSLHSGAVKALALLPQSVGPYALTAGQDQQLLLSRLPILATPPNGAAGDAAATPLAAYRDHSDAVCALACAPRGDAFASAGWDCSLRVWDLGEPVLACI
jgi:WD40 repeat protein